MWQAPARFSSWETPFMSFTAISSRNELSYSHPLFRKSSEALLTFEVISGKLWTCLGVTWTFCKTLWVQGLVAILLFDWFFGYMMIFTYVALNSWMTVWMTNWIASGRKQYLPTLSFIFKDCLKGLRKNTKNFSQFNLSLDRDSRPRHSDYEAGMLVARLRSWVYRRRYEYTVKEILKVLVNEQQRAESCDYCPFIFCII
jgi:hypothetical protein